MDPQDAGTGIKISVVVAVYNSGTYVDDLIDSLLKQTMPRAEFEVVFVDDDSTDGTRQRLEAFAAGQPNVRVLHNSPNSGWPGRPRNLGIDAAAGTYVFFADHDDWFPPAALSNLWAFAQQHNSDVVLGKEIGHRHWVPWTTYAANIPDARLGTDPLLEMLTPHKLFRRALLDEHGIRFPEGRVRLEDHLFVVRAYFAADVVSMSSEPCYHWVHRDDTNASLHVFDPYLYFPDLEKVFDVVAANTEPGALRNRLYGEWYPIKLLGRISGRGFLHTSPERQRALFAEVRRVVLDRFDESMDDALAPADRARAHLLRADRFDLVLELAWWEVGTTTSVALTELGWRDGELVVSTATTPVRADGSPLLFDEVDGRLLRVLPDSLAEQLPDHTRDLTDWIPRTFAGLILRDRSSHEVVDITPGCSIETVAADGHLTLVARTTATIDPRTAFAGAPLPRFTDVSARFLFGGWRSERRVPFDPAVTGPLESLVASFDQTEVRAYPTQDTSNLSIKRLGRPPRPLQPPAPIPPAPTSPAASPVLPKSLPRPRSRLRRLLVRMSSRLPRGRRRTA